MMREMEEEMEPMVTTNIEENQRKKGGLKKVILTIFCVIIGLAVLYLIASLGIKSYNRSRYKDEFYLQQEVQEYLEERYNEEFIVMFNRGMSGAYNYVQLYAYPIAYQDEMHKIEIQGYYNKWGKLDYYDDYVMIKLTEEYEAYIDPIIDEYFDEYKFYIDFNSEWLTNNLPADTKLEDLWGLKANEDYPLPTLCIFFGVDEEGKYNGDELILTMESLRNKDFRGCVETLIILDKELYRAVTPENNHEILEGQQSKYEGNVIFIYNDRVEY